MLTRLATPCIGTAFQNTLLKEGRKAWQDDEEQASSYWVTLMKQKDTKN
jgi:hypothetical protein